MLDSSASSIGHSRYVKRSRNAASCLMRWNPAMLPSPLMHVFPAARMMQSRCLGTLPIGKAAWPFASAALNASTAPGMELSSSSKR